MAMKKTQTVGAYQAKTHLPSLLGRVSRGREVLITKNGKPVARLVPADKPTGPDRTVFTRIRAMHSRLSLGDGVTAKDLINEGRRI